MKNFVLSLKISSYLCLLIILNACGPDFSIEDADMIYQRGIQKLNNKNYEGALRDFSIVIDLKPSFAEAYKQRAFVNSRLNNYKQAIKDLSKVIELDPDNNINAYYFRGLNKSMILDDYGAIQDFSEVLKYLPDYKPALFQRASAYLGLKDYQSVINDFDRLIELDPENEKAYFYRAYAKIETDDYNGALEDCNKLISINPFSGKGFFMRGNTYYKMDEINKACDDWNKASNLGYSGVREFINNYCD